MISYYLFDKKSDDFEFISALTRKIAIQFHSNSSLTSTKIDLSVETPLESSKNLLLIERSTNRSILNYIRLMALIPSGGHHCHAFSCKSVIIVPQWRNCEEVSHLDLKFPDLYQDSTLT